MVEMFNQANNVVIESSAINVHVNELTSKQTNLIKLREVADWLTPINFRTIQSDTFLKHTPGTGQWFLESQDFSKWISGEQRSLSVLGIPGAGKTILSSIVISHLELYISKNVKAALAYAYFRHNDSYSLSDILAAMIKQLIEGHHIAYAYLEGIYDDYKKKAVRPPVDDLARILRGLIERLGKVYIVVDALDEASEDCRSEFLRVLSNLSISLLTTSRPLDLSRLLPELTVEVRISGQTSYDIESFAARCLKQSHRIQAITKGDQVLQAEILGKLKSKSQGMFLAVSLHADTLSQCTNKKQLMEVAARLPSTLDAIYESTLQRIEAQGPQVARIARSTILWVIYAYQSLRAKVLERAVAISPDKPGFCSDNIIPLELLVTWCCGLVVVDEESNLVRLAHYTTYDFFKSLRTGDFRNPHTSITSSCIAYLQAFDFQNFTNFLRPDWSGEILEGNFFNEDGLYRYAHKFWGKHARCSQVAADLPICVAEFMSSIQEYPILSEEEDEYVFWPTYCTAAYFGLVDVLRIIQDFHCQLTPDGRTSLMLAADRGHFDVVEYILLCQDVDINAIDNAGHTALHLATSEGHGAVVKLLLAQPDIDVNTQHQEKAFLP
ncbi:hypothetical protein CVT26_008089 [Gymnopilus dilepis]|uniref:Nephrocystin 3-like N-terminal domain-containing protein n=1 Tax=Gymnopilus dilepis TaxID=231916 RepID=A0A409X2J3_9AGAR|nr:hypothetical protein CVT26_008089 [Gymnopilus dilepis]